MSPVGYAQVMTVAQLTHDALALPREERADLAMRLLESLDASSEQAAHDRAWSREIVRRLESLEAGETTTRPARRVVAEMRERLRART